MHRSTLCMSTGGLNDPCWISTTYLGYFSSGYHASTHRTVNPNRHRIVNSKVVMGKLIANDMFLIDWHITEMWQMSKPSMLQQLSVLWNTTAVNGLLIDTWKSIQETCNRHLDRFYSTFYNTYKFRNLAPQIIFNSRKVRMCPFAM